MSFGGSGFGGFGQTQNNTQQSSGFGGFGQNNNSNNTLGGFGANNNNSTTGGFGQSNTGTGIFGNNNASSGSGFGATTSTGFGANAGGFGAKPAFGSTATNTGGGIFGSSTPASNTTTSTFGGGFGNTTANTSSPFGGASNPGGGLFGGSNAAKPAFGSTPTTGTTGGSLFGGGATSSGFGSAGGFGATNNPGLGGAVGDPPGTASTQFQAFTEKEPKVGSAPGSAQTNSFQNIAFQDPYKKWSPEELRLADYAQGRRYGNASGGGAFGVGSNFGGFGSNTNNQQNSTFGATSNNNTTSGLFGASNTTTNNTSTGFGGGAFGSNTTTNNTTSSLFGNKPSTGFGGTTQTSAGGGLFGSTPASNTGTTGFGAQQNLGGFGQNTTSSPGLFGSNNNEANKPAGFSFGNTNNNTTTTSAFGNTSNNAFGANNNTTGGTGLFGNNNTQNTSGGLFGNNSNNNQQQQGASTGLGGFGQPSNQNQQTGSSLFGNQQKPAGGLFGTSTTNTQTGGGLFGNNNQQQQTNTGFGANNTTPSGGLFGAPKPATGTSLFGSSTTQPSTGTSLFGGLGGNSQAQQPANTGLFGNSNNQQQKPSLFGTSTQSTGGGSLFGGGNQAQGSLLGGNNQQQNSGLGSSLLGNSQQASNAPQGLTANLNDVSAYGSPSLFMGVGGNEVPNPGPLATPVNGNSKPRRGSVLPMYRLAPASASRYSTPQKRGFGFSHSTYGTPGVSPASSISSTPGTLGRSLLGASASGSLSKSMSTNNLRRSYNTEDSILAPGAFSSSSGGTRWYGSTGSKKLIINRDIRSDLFSTPTKDKLVADTNTGPRKLAKRVSFDTSNVDAEDPTTPGRGAQQQIEDATAEADETPRQNKVLNGSNGPKAPEVEQVKGNELAIVHEEDQSSATRSPSVNGLDNAPGEYWMTPTLDELRDMNRVQRAKIDRFQVGRENVGSITFKLPVDISGLDVEEICGEIIQLEPRSATVYPVSAKKPPVGKGLNVPARISLEQSWPRGNKRSSADPKRSSKHVERLRRIPDTEFESYDEETGVWTFHVEHFTTYGLDDSDDESGDELSAAPEADATDFSKSQQLALDASMDSLDDDDTFDFRQSRGLPGAFDDQGALFAGENNTRKSFLGVSSADSAPNNVHLSLEEEVTDNMVAEYDMSDDEDMAGSLSGQHLAVEREDFSPEVDQELGRSTPGGILRARMRAMKDSIGPMRLEVADGDDWMEMLRKTVSPIKRDRQLLRDINESGSPRTGLLVNLDDEGDNTTFKSSITRKNGRSGKVDTLSAGAQLSMDKGKGFATSIDLMNSLFEKPKPTPLSRGSESSKGFPKWPYERQDKTLTVDQEEQAFHDASRPTWGPDDILVVTRPLYDSRRRRGAKDSSDLLSFQRSGIQTSRQDLRLARFSVESSKKFLRTQENCTEIRVVGGVPVASLRATGLRDLFHNQDMQKPASQHEKQVWELASILFDKVPTVSSLDLDEARKANLSQFWTELVEQSSSKSIGLAGSSTEKALACLAGHRVPEACKHLLDGKNFRLATLVALIGSNDSAKKEMKDQLTAWRDSKMLSEFTEAIRTIYELLSGNVSVCEGLKGVPVEDRLDSFVISRKFGFDWKQSFGLRLWYAISKNDDLSEAVRLFKDDLDQDREDSPRPWYAEQGFKPVWNDEHANKRQDLLWGLLRLYAEADTDLADILQPENSQLSPLDMRLSWQLGLALQSTGQASYGKNSEEKADAATLAYASQLTGAGEWLEAVFVLLHLSNSNARAKAIRDHLCRHAHHIGSETTESFAILSDTFQVPSKWIWEALALYRRSVKKDANGEVQCLIRAELFLEAHKVLVNQVAPLAIIERDYAGLSHLISQFQGYETTITDWPNGGEIYGLFLSLVQHRSRNEQPPLSLLERLLSGLPAMNDGLGDNDITRFAAVSDMADETAREIVKFSQSTQDNDLRSKVLGLPLTQDRVLAYSVDFSLDLYQEVMAQ